MTKQEADRMCSKATQAAVRQQADDAYIVYCETAIALHNMGWGERKVHNLFTEVQKINDDHAEDNSRSMTQIFFEETGIELKPSEGDKSWEDLAYLNKAIEFDSMTPQQYTYMRARQRRWIKTELYASVFLALHRRYGWGASRVIELLADIQELDRRVHSAKQARKAYTRVTGKPFIVTQVD